MPPDPYTPLSVSWRRWNRQSGNGRVAESTAYLNWLDPYVQVGLVDASNLTT